MPSTDINFENIRPYDGHKWKGFEELVCQLARRERPGLRRVEGAGGDAGVEAYWLGADGSKIGFQAKYFTKAANIDWRQVDRSVSRASSPAMLLLSRVT